MTTHCTCHVGARGREDTVGCRVHHIMPDGCVAADHEIRCSCGNFKCDHDCTRYEREDEDGYDLQYVCTECELEFVEADWTRADA